MQAKSSHFTVAKTIVLMVDISRHLIRLSWLRWSPVQPVWISWSSRTRIRWKTSWNVQRCHLVLNLYTTHIRYVGNIAHHQRCKLLSWIIGQWRSYPAHRFIHSLTFCLVPGSRLRRWPVNFCVGMVYMNRSIPQNSIPMNTADHYSLSHDKIQRCHCFCHIQLW